MAKAFANLALSLTARTEKFTRGMKRASKQIVSFKQIAKGIGVGIGVAAFGAITRSIRGFVSNLKEAADSFDRLAKQARTIGLTANALQNLRLEGKLAGVEIRVVDKALLNLQRNSADAANGIGEAIQAFKDLNINAKEFLDLSIEKKLRQLADGLSKLSKAKQIGALADLFGLRGIEFARILPSLATGGRSIGQSDLFPKISDADATKVERFNDAITLLGENITRMTQKFIAEMSPALEQFVGSLDEFVRLVLKINKFLFESGLVASPALDILKFIFDIAPSRIVEELNKRIGASTALNLSALGAGGAGGTGAVGGSIEGARSFGSLQTELPTAALFSKSLLLARGGNVEQKQLTELEKINKGVKTLAGAGGLPP